MRAGGVYDVMICGGGPAGLTLAALLSEKGYNVALFEKKKYPTHKVCGEYLGKEVRPVMDHLGIDLNAAGASDIEHLHIRSSSGNELSTHLDLGAWGLSRYSLDKILFDKAKEKSVQIFTDEPVRDIKTEGSFYSVKTTEGIYFGRKVVGAFGKRDLLDKTLKRPFLQKRSGFMAVKHHLRSGFDTGVIGLYPFKNGFAGVTKVEGGRTCLCYLMKRENMVGFRTIAEMEKSVLYKNPDLNRLFESSEHLYEHPLVINEFSFEFKELYKDGIYYLGDSAAMIAPVCGNGMAMAIRGALLLAEALDIDLKGNPDLAVSTYLSGWKKSFSSRLKAGQLIQNLLLSPQTLNVVLPVLSLFPGMSRSLIRMTHGKAEAVATDLY